MTRLLLDSASLYYRSYFALPESITAPDGTPVNAVRGFLDTVAALVTDRGSSSVVACWDDDWRPQWRVDLVPSYKTHRVAEDLGDPTAEEVPDTLAAQVDLLRQVLPLLGIPVVGAAGAEADDVIATLCAASRTDVASGDRDLVQLVSDSTTLLFTGGTSASRGGQPWIVYTPSEVQARFGVRPSQYADLAILRGDPSDGLPGVKGIGEKTAVALVQAFGGLDGIWAALRDPESPRPMTAGIRGKLLAAEAELPRWDAVVRLVPREGITLPRESEPDPDAALEFGDTWGVRRAVERILAAL